MVQCASCKSSSHIDLVASREFAGHGSGRCLNMTPIAYASLVLHCQNGSSWSQSVLNLGWVCCAYSFSCSVKSPTVSICLSAYNCNHSDVICVLGISSPPSWRPAPVVQMLWHQKCTRIEIVLRWQKVDLIITTCLLHLALVWVRPLILCAQYWRPKISQPPHVTRHAQRALC